MGAPVALAGGARRPRGHASVSCVGGASAITPSVIAGCRQDRTIAAQPESRTPRNSAPSALRPESAPKAARPAVDLARACNAAVSPEIATTTSLMINVVPYELDQSGRIARMFQIPVATRTANAPHAIALKRRATARGASGESRRNPGVGPNRRAVRPLPHRPTGTAPLSDEGRPPTPATISPVRDALPRFLGLLEHHPNSFSSSALAGRLRTRRTRQICRSPLVVAVGGAVVTLVVVGPPRVEPPMPYARAADFVAITHAAFIAFLLVGGYAAWQFPRLVWVHIPAVVVTAAIFAFGADCPLTDL